jgi:ribosome maturation factor RimP
MNFDSILDALKQASGFELYRLRAMLDRVLDDPKWIIAVQKQLLIGQQINYYDAGSNTEFTAQVLEFRRKQVVVRDVATQKRWLIPYTAINLGGADIKIREADRAGLSRHEVAVGETVGFIDGENRQRHGKIIRLNDKTVTLECDGQKWRVSYNYLHWVLDSDSL